MFIVDEEIKLVPYYPYEKRTLSWYQDLELCKQVDNKATPYDTLRLKKMYHYLNKQGSLFYIKYKNHLCGDVTLEKSGEIAIVIAHDYQNKHIGRRVIGEILKLAKDKKMEKVFATIYEFNTQSIRMFTSVGFQKIDKEMYVKQLI